MKSMILNLLATMVAWGAAVPGRRYAVADAANEMAIKYRMNAGFPGDVSRTHPVSIEPALVGAAGVGASFGLPVIVDAANGVRGFTVGDEAVDTLWGVTARPYPTQQRSGGDSSSFGTGTPPAAGGIVGVARQAYIMGRLNDVAAAPKKGAAVFIWCAATAGIHVQGGWEVVASGGNTAALDPEKYSFNGPGDAAGNIELCINI